MTLVCQEVPVHIEVKSLPPQSNEWGAGAAHHGSIIFWERARGIDKTGEIGVNDSHRRDPFMEKFGIFIIRDLQGTSQGIRR